MILKLFNDVSFKIISVAIVVLIYFSNLPKAVVGFVCCIHLAFCKKGFGPHPSFGLENLHI